MSDWRAALREADPVRRGEPRHEAIERVRSRVLAAAGQPVAAPRQASSRSLVFVAAMSVVVLAAVGAAWQTGIRGKAVPTKVDRLLDSRSRPPGGGEAPVSERQQLHFATPGGTRIIWVFDPAFEIKGTVP